MKLLYSFETSEANCNVPAASSQKNGSLTLKGFYSAKLKYVTLSNIVSSSTRAKFIVNFKIVPRNRGGTLLVAQLVEALRYKPQGRGFDSRWCH